MAFLSIAPALNLVSPQQAMNTSYDPLHLVNSYGAFGSITRPRYEVIVEGTSGDASAPDSSWREYGFKGKPGDPRRRPPQIAPYHLRLDWLMWFCGFTPWYGQPWFANFVAKLLQNDEKTLSLIAENPFPGKPPRFVRARLYEYRFTTREERAKTGATWVRTLRGEYFPRGVARPPGFPHAARARGLAAGGCPRLARSKDPDASSQAGRTSFWKLDARSSGESGVASRCQRSSRRKGVP